MSTKLSDEKSIEAIISEMSVEEKARLVNGGSPFRSAAMEKYGIPSLFMLDSCNGVNSLEYAGENMYQKIVSDAENAGHPLDPEQNGNMGGLLFAFGELQKAAIQRAKSGALEPKKELGCYPPGITMGSSWNPKAIEECGQALAREMGSKGVDAILGPNINIHRDPLCGRLAESFSEDPCLVANLAPAMIRGIQKEGLIATVKHFAANNQEKDRMGVEEHISERALREIYFPGFKACSDAGCKSIMSAYNKINGVASAQNEYLLTKVLREEWGFQGFVVSDWGASYDMVDAIAAGNDLTMPGPRGVKKVVQAVKEGRLSEEKLDRCVGNILRNLITSTAFTKAYPSFSMEETRIATENMAKEGIILLKNDGTLPLEKNNDVVFYGKRSKRFISGPAGSSAVTTDLLTNPYDRTVELLGADKVHFEETNDATKYWIVVVGADGQEGKDRASLDMDMDEKEALEQAIAEAKKTEGKVILVINATGPINLTEYESRVNAILCPFFAGMQGGKVTADTIFGLNNPSGKLPLTWPKKYQDCPSYKNFPGENMEVWYGEGIYVGYRWYDARQIEPMYPFGYGLSYTTFELSDLQILDENGQKVMNQAIDVETSTFNISVTVKNTGTVAGSEVVQIYVHNYASKFDRPVKELKGFQKVFLEPGKETQVSISLDKQGFSNYYLEFGEWITEPGDKEIMVGTSARDIRLQQTITIKCKDPFGLSWRTSIGAIAKNHDAVKAINQIINDDIILIADVAINFAPDKSIKEIWEGTAVQGALKSQGLDDQAIKEKFDQVLAAFDLICS